MREIVAALCNRWGGRGERGGQAEGGSSAIAVTIWREAGGDLCRPYASTWPCVSDQRMAPPSFICLPIASQAVHGVDGGLCGEPRPGTSRGPGEGRDVEPMSTQLCYTRPGMVGAAGMSSE